MADEKELAPIKTLNLHLTTLYSILGISLIIGSVLVFNQHSKIGIERVKFEIEKDREIQRKLSESFRDYLVILSNLEEEVCDDALRSLKDIEAMYKDFVQGFSTEQTALLFKPLEEAENLMIEECQASIEVSKEITKEVNRIIDLYDD